MRLVKIREKTLAAHAEVALEIPAGSLTKGIARLGKSAGPPWGKDQKEAALAALVALRGRIKRRERRALKKENWRLHSCFKELVWEAFLK